MVFEGYRVLSNYLLSHSGFIGIDGASNCNAYLVRLVLLLSITSQVRYAGVRAGQFAFTARTLANIQCCHMELATEHVHACCDVIGVFAARQSRSNQVCKGSRR